jgi:hypothetical protein
MHARLTKARLAHTNHYLSSLALGILLAACGGEDNPMRDGDAGIDDFDPTTMYEGEGDACRFSIECSHRQICVDDVCTRHERITPDSVEFAETRWLGPGQIETSPIHERASMRWDDIVGDALVHMLSWITPGRDTPQLVVLLVDPEDLAPNDCQVLIVGEELSVVTLFQLGCTAATVREDGELAVVGRDAETGATVVVRQASNGSTLYRTAIPDEVQDVLTAAGQPALSWRGAISTAFDGDSVVVAFRVGRESGDTVLYGADIHGLVFVEVDGEGMARLLEPGIPPLVPGDLGFLVRDADGVKAVIADVDPDSLEYTSPTLLHLLDGSREPLSVAVADQVRFAQPEATRWVVETGVAEEDVPRTLGCLVSVTDSANMVTTEVPTSGSCNPRNPVIRDFAFAESATFMPAWVEHSRAQLVEFTPFAVYELDGELETTLEYAVDRPALVYVPRIGAVSRFRLTFEGIHGAHREGPPFDWFERALRSR